MAEQSFEKVIRVHVLGREYSLRVHEEDEDLTRDIAAYVDGKMQAFKETHPGQSELTTAVITALAIAEELYSTWEEQEDEEEVLEDALDRMANRLRDALGPREPEAEASLVEDPRDLSIDREDAAE